MEQLLQKNFNNNFTIVKHKELKNESVFIITENFKVKEMKPNSPKMMSLRNVVSFKYDKNDNLVIKGNKNKINKNIDYNDRILNILENERKKNNFDYYKQRENKLYGDIFEKEFFDKKINFAIKKYKDEKDRQVKRSIINFSEKFDLNFFDGKENFSFYTFTIQTNKIYNKNNELINSNVYYYKDNNNKSIQAIKQVDIDKANDLKYCKKLFSNFIKNQNKKNNLFKNKKYVYVFERQKKGTWHIHLICEKLYLHDGCMSNFKNKKYKSCFECNNILGMKWGYGWVDVKVIKQIKKGQKKYKSKNNLYKGVLNYLKKYVAKSQKNNLDFKNNLKYFVFSNSCENVKNKSWLFNSNFDIKNKILNEIKKNISDYKINIINNKNQKMFIGTTTIIRVKNDKKENLINFFNENIVKYNYSMFKIIKNKYFNKIDYHLTKKIRNKSVFINIIEKHFLNFMECLGQKKDFIEWINQKINYFRSYLKQFYFKKWFIPRKKIIYDFCFNRDISFS